MKHALSVHDLGTILAVWAHPDDEAFSSAGLMLRAVKNGQRVIVVSATYGDAGESADEKKWPKYKLAAIREAELTESLRIIGVTEHFWLGYKDGALKTVPSSEAVGKIATALNDVTIDTIITFEEQGITGHEDHKTVHAWGVELAEKLRARLLCATECQEFYLSKGKQLHDKHNVYFNVAAPNVVGKAECDLCIELTADEKETKIRALAAHASQTLQMFADTESREALEEMAACECFVEIP